MLKGKTYEQLSREARDKIPSPLRRPFFQAVLTLKNQGTPANRSSIAAIMRQWGYQIEEADVSYAITWLDCAGFSLIRVSLRRNIHSSSKERPCAYCGDPVRFEDRVLTDAWDLEHMKIPLDTWMCVECSCK